MFWPGWKGICPANKKNGPRNDFRGPFLCLIEEIVKRIAPPPPAIVGCPPHLHVAARGQTHQQFQTGAPAAHGQHILPRPQETEAGLARTQQVTVPAVAAPPGTQADRVPGTAAGYGHRNTTQQPGRKGAEILLRLLILPQAEGPASLKPAYCSIFALTIYWPSVTPPNRYIPWVLVLVVATRVSVWSSPRPVT